MDSVDDPLAPWRALEAQREALPLEDQAVFILICVESILSTHPARDAAGQEYLDAIWDAIGADRPELSTIAEALAQRPDIDDHDERAVKEGRRIYDNIRKSVLFLLPTNGAQSLVILVAVLFGLTLPLQPVQVLWINMITAVTLSLALAYEKAEPDVMRRAPRDPKASILDGAYVRRILLVSLLIGGATILLFYVERAQGVPLAEAQTTAVTMLALGQLAYLFNCRFLDRSSLTLDVLRGNRVVWVSAATLLALQAVFVYAPFMHSWFDSAPIALAEWGKTLGLALVVFLLVEVIKWVGRRWTARDHVPALVERHDAP